MDIYRITLVAISLFGTAVSANYDPTQVWFSSKNKDDFTNKVTYSASGISGTDYTSPTGRKSFIRRSGYSFGIRCDISKGNNSDFMLSFSVDSALATPNSSITVFAKVDENKPIEFSGRLYSNSYKSGFIRLTKGNKNEVEKLISQGIAGDELTVRVQDERKSSIEDFSVLLRGFTKQTSQVLKACDVTANKTNITDSDKARLKEIDKKINKLEYEKEKILSNY